MTEHRVVELNENDIKQILAETFKVSEQEVQIKVYSGDPQYPERRIYAEIRTYRTNES